MLQRLTLETTLVYAFVLWNVATGFPPVRPSTLLPIVTHPMANRNIDTTPDFEAGALSHLIQIELTKVECGTQAMASVRMQMVFDSILAALVEEVVGVDKLFELRFDTEDVGNFHSTRGTRETLSCVRNDTSMLDSSCTQRKHEERYMRCSIYNSFEGYSIDCRQGPGENPGRSKDDTSASPDRAVS
ncbi:hypothetical protein K469DRAFT_281310 [Zopfia rhizophila CBS 207.26]|uniref:Secreted protein n=1 Tax=Zopfia rhizophila CBS 207.26 TaxID=1314779 RepID=A0A6A6EPL4_9PEZI|nr:hypothetical protein K469DRAFT_281310 [Zopfia rhizophila CBS 207.26]